MLNKKLEWTRVYVNGLTFKVTKEILFEHFEKEIGGVFEANVFLFPGKTYRTYGSYVYFSFFNIF